MGLLGNRKFLWRILSLMCCNILQLHTKSPLEAAYWSGQHVLQCEIESIMRAWLIRLSRFLFWLRSVTEACLKGTVTMLLTYTNDHPLWTSVNGIGISPTNTLSRFSSSYLWGCWLNCCSRYIFCHLCVPLFILPQHLILKHVNKRAYELVWHLQW